MIFRYNPFFLSNKNLHCSKWGDCGNGTIIGAPINTIVSNLVEKRENILYKRVLMNQHQSKSSKPTGAL